MSGDDIVGHSDYYHSQEFADRRNLYDDIHRRTYEFGVYVDEFSTELDAPPRMARCHGVFCPRRRLCRRAQMVSTGNSGGCFVNDFNCRTNHYSDFLSIQQERTNKVTAMIAELDRLPKCLRRTADGKIVIRQKENTMEQIEETQLAMATPLALAKPTEILAEAQEAATALKRVIDQKEDKVMINGKVYLEFEDWSTVGSFYRVTAGADDAIPTIVEEISGAKAFGYAICRDTGRRLSTAVAYCMRDEPNWQSKPWFQLASMAQTRAAAKALRNVLSRVVVLAGYKSTPAEEMTSGSNNIVFPFGKHKGRKPEELTDSELEQEGKFWNDKAREPNNKFAENNRRLAMLIEGVLMERQGRQESAEPPQPKNKALPTTAEAKRMTKIKDLLLNEAKKQGLIGENQTELNETEKSQLSAAMWRILGGYPKNENDILICTQQIKAESIFEVRMPDEV